MENRTAAVRRSKNLNQLCSSVQLVARYFLSNRKKGDFVQICQHFSSPLFSVMHNFFHDLLSRWYECAATGNAAISSGNVAIRQYGSAAILFKQNFSNKTFRKKQTFITKSPTILQSQSYVSLMRNISKNIKPFPR